MRVFPNAMRFLGNWRLVEVIASFQLKPQLTIDADDNETYLLWYTL